MLEVGRSYIKANIYVKEGSCSPALMIPYEAKSIASIIMQAAMAEKILFTNIFDITEIKSVFGGLIMYCKNQEFLLTELLPALQPIQIGEADPEPVEVFDWGVDGDAPEQEVKDFLSQYGIELNTIDRSEK